MKRAFIVGINYTGTQAELRGCINDAYNMQAALKRMGFNETRLCLEKEATTAGIISGLRWLVTGAVPGDVLVFHYSGHGSQVRSNIEPDALDEIICPIDLDWKRNVIKDDDLKAIFETVPNGVNITIILDCCHSGSGLDQSETLFSPREVEGSSLGDPVTPVFNPGKGTSRYLPPPPDVLHDIEENRLPLREWKTSRDVNRTAVLIAGCLPHQTSADAYIAGQFQGAATFSLLQAISQGKRTYRDIVLHMTRFMESGGFTQRPQLDGHPSLYDQVFAEPWGFSAGATRRLAPGDWRDRLACLMRAGGLSSKNLGGWVLAGAVLFSILLALFLFAR